MTDADIIDLFSGYVFDEEVGEMSFVDGFFRVNYERGPGHLIKVCTADEFNKGHEKILAAAVSHEKCDQLIIYLIGERDESIDILLPGWAVVIRQIYEAWGRYPQLLDLDDPLGDYVRSTVVDTYSKALAELEIGDGPAHQELVARIFYLSLRPRILSIKLEAQSLNRRARRDIVLRLNGGHFAQHLFRAHLPSNNVLIECKNKQKIEGSDVDQIANYLGPAKVASVGLFVTRKPLTKEMRSIAVEHRRDRDGKIAIIPMDDALLLTMLDNIRDANFDANEGLLIGLFEHLLLDVH